MSAPTAGITSNKTNVAMLNTTHHGFGTLHRGSSLHSLCPDVEYSADEAWVTINTAQFESAMNKTSVCGKYVKVNRADKPSEHYTYKVVDSCESCKKNSLGFSETALRELTNLSRVAIDWELIENEREDDLVIKKAIKYAEIHEEALHEDNEDAEDAEDTEIDHPVTAKSNSRSYRGRGTWFSDTMGSCGHRFSQRDMIVALNQAQMGAMWGKNSKCGAKIRVAVRGRPSRSVVVRVVDTCPHRFCSFGQLDLSQAAFKKFAPMRKGILDLVWTFL
ncbi:hypothetical protein BGX31_000270 [Mortierella sp. GBA43]|nr:hypothetical protein BGX31_000270 [Mortierella sp. GBA43]